MQKPAKNFVSFYRREGNYNWLNSKDVSAQYVFTFPEGTPLEGLSISYTVDIEKDYDRSPDEYTALEMAEEIKKIFDGYWIHSEKGKINELVEYLRSIEEGEEVKRLQYMTKLADYKIWEWQQKKQNALDELKYLLQE